MMKVFGYYKHDGPGGNTDKICKLRDVDTPRNVTAHTCDTKPVIKLIYPAGKTNAYYREQKYDPSPVSLTSD